MTASGISVRTVAGSRAAPAGWPPTTSSDDELDRHVLLADDVARGVGSDDVDVVARPGGDERCRRGTEHVLAPLRTLVERDEAGESDDHERAERAAGTDDDEELARSLADCCDGEHRRRGERRGGEDGEPLAAEPLLRVRVRLGELRPSTGCSAAVPQRTAASTKNRSTESPTRYQPCSDPKP